MKKIFLLLVLLFLLNNAYSNYITPGTGKSWTLDSLVLYSAGDVTFSGGIYFVNDTVYVSSSDTLKILNNATVKLAYLVTFNFVGTLIVNPPDSVKITSIDTTQKFYELRLDSLSDASIIRKTIFEYSFNGMRLLDTNPIIDSCIIRYNCGGNTSTTVPSVNLFRSSPVISNCKIYRNAKVAIGGGANINNAPQILNNEIYENDWANGNVPQINLGASGSGTTLIKGNTIIGLYTNSGGIATLPIGTLNIRIENNIIKNNRYGIAITNANTNAVIRGNIIDSNNIQGISNLGGSGINFNGTSTVTAIITGNSIRGNLWGITIQGTALPDLGNIFNSDTTDNGNNRIYFNTHNDSTFDLYNNTPDSIYAQNNYWGTYNLDSIEMHIFHKPDNPALGFVNYLPIMLPIGIHNNSNELPKVFKLYDAYPNPFNPSTKIKFFITSLLSFGKGNGVRLTIYDILGREVTTLVNEQLKTGKYEYVWDAEGGASNFASGIYFYKLSIIENNKELFNETKRLILIK